MTEKEICSLVFLLTLVLSGCSTAFNGDCKMEEYRPALSFYYDDKGNFINYEKKGNGPVPVILIHGFGSSIRNWDDVVARIMEDKTLRKKFTLYVIDLKGAGFSSKPKDDHYAVSDNAAIVRKFIENLKLHHPVIAGHSLGGGVTLYLTVRMNPESQSFPSHLFLIDSACYPTDYPFFVKFLRIPLLNTLLLDTLPDEYRARQTLERIITDKSLITDELIHRYSYAYRMDNYTYALIQTAKQIQPDNVDELVKKYKEIRCPVTILWGREDNVLSVKLGEALHRDIPDSELFVYDGFGHALPEEAPDIVAEAVRSGIIQAYREREKKTK